jgi:lipid-binding SYLF domain-containing protein
MKVISTAVVLVLALMLVNLVGCSTEPRTQEAKDALSADVDSAIKDMQITDPGFDKFLKDSYAYAVFPTVGKGAFIVGGAYGKGMVYQGEMIGYSDISQANVGLQAGGQTYKEVICFQNDDALKNFEAGKLKFSADASAVALKSGASASAKFQDGVVVFTHPNGGLMFEASIGGQSFSYRPK